MAKELDKLRKIITLDSSLQTIQDLDLLLERILLEARQFTHADSGTIYLTRGDELVFAYSQNNTKQKELRADQKLPYTFFAMPINKDSIGGYVAITKKILNIRDVYSLPADTPYHFNPGFDRKSGYKTTSMLTIPLVTTLKEVVGVIQVINAMNEEGAVVPFDKDDELLVNHFASVASQALQRAQLTRQILLRMISMAELRDPKETGPHVNRVAAIAVEIYERWAIKHGMERRQIDRDRDLLRMAAMLHDVGKVAISDLILKKPGRFTEEEYEVMKSHTYCGARLFRYKQSEFDEIALQVAMTHHENWDGTGYPGNVDLETGKPRTKDKTGAAVRLNGEQIPVFGRVVAVADVFDALSCRRVYKQPWPEEQVIAEMRSMSGKKLDPELVEIFFEAHGHIKQIYEQYPDSEEE
jgi:HD-GYP domain-containing protein (c-di-GMP phosphodiesterase class II)